MNAAEVLAKVLREHADCVVNSGQDLGASVTGVDVWSCGITLPFVNDLEACERAHVAAAQVAALEAEGLLPESTVVEEWGVRYGETKRFFVCLDEQAARSLVREGLCDWRLLRRARTTYADRVTEWEEVDD